MKNVLLFVAIITICSSVMKAPIYRMCQTELKIRYYLKGKLVYSEESQISKYWSANRIPDKVDKGNGDFFYSDSFVVEPKYTTYRMVD